jgi:Domain of unknown function (DUF4157)
MGDARAAVPKPAAVVRKAAAVTRAPASVARTRAAAAGSIQRRLGNQGAQALGSQLVSRKAALSISQPDDAHEREAESVADAVMRMPAPAPSNPAVARAMDTGGAVVHRRCSACAQEEESERRVNRHASADAGPEVTPAIAANINALQGRGEPLPAASRAFFEPRFGADFSQVRVHTDTQAARTASSINAHAFTVGSDIAFASGQYAPGSSAGQRLIAHELTHVVQQGGSVERKVQRDDVDDAQPPAPDPAPDPVSNFNPDDVVQKLLWMMEEGDFLDEDPDADPDVEPSDDEKAFQLELEEAEGWRGSGAAADRRILLLRSEDVRLQKDSAYRAAVFAEFGKRQFPDDEYRNSLFDTYDPVSETEAATLARINANLPGLALTDNNFVDNEQMQAWDAGNAFPAYSWNIIAPLVAPSSGIRASAPANVRSTQDALTGSWGALGMDLYLDGIPASYARSLTITDYSTIKSRTFAKLLKMPSRAWIFEQFVMPEEVSLHSDAMNAYTSSVTAFVLASLEKAVFDKWTTATAMPWGAYDAFAISRFRMQHPSGLGSVAEFFDYQSRGVGFAAGVGAQKIKAHIASSGANPFLVLARLSGDAQGLAPPLLKSLNAGELQNFRNILETADSKIAAMDAAIRLMTAIEWSVTKGFATSGIYALLQNLDDVLIEMLKEVAKDLAKDQLLKKAISLAGTYGGFWGKAIAVAYNLWNLLDDVRDKIELAETIASVIEVLDEAKNSKKVVDTQRSAAKLAQMFETAFQRLVQKLGAKLLAKLSAAAVKKLKDRSKARSRMGDAERHNLLEDSRDQKDAKKLKPEEVEAEFQTAIKSPVKVAGDAIEIELPNGHKWKRMKGAKGWCRASEDCVGDFLNPDASADLAAYARQHLPKDFDHDGYESLFDHPLLHQTSKGNFGEVMSDRMMARNYKNMGGMTHPENPDRGPGIDNVWKPRDTTHFDYTVSETKFVKGFDGNLSNVRMGKSISGPQLSDSWIAGRDYNSMKYRLDEIVGEDMATKMRMSIHRNRVERLLIVVDETGKSWVFEVDAGGTGYRERKD